ncbi:MAG: isoprenylcysteine carboxylmethyltransferase family protein [Armatimonadota bacterium]
MTVREIPAPLRKLRRIYGHLPLGVIGLIIAKPTPGSTVLGTGFVLAGVLIRLWAAGFLEKGGDQLCIDGPYRYLRHPLYLGSFIAAVGFAIMMHVIWGWVIILPLFALLYLVQVVDEERHLRSVYGDAHSHFSRSVPALIPWPGRAAQPHGRRWSMARMLKNHEHWHVLVTLGFAVLFFVRTWVW